MKHIVHIITGLQRGGAETMLLTLVTELAQAPYDYKQSVIYFKDGVMREQLEARGIACYKASYAQTFWLIKKLNPDLIHSSLWSANIIARLCARLLAIPIYCALHNSAEHSGLLRNYIDRFFPFRPTSYIAVSHQVKESYTHFLPAQNITVIENGISPAYHPSPRRSRDEKYTIGAIGRFVPVKNYHILLEAYALIHQKFPHTRLVLVGHGPLERQLRDQAQQLNISPAVTFVINQPAHNYYPQFDCFVQPSQHEGLSIALLEALQADVPVIVTGHDRRHTFIEDKKHGLVIEPNSVHELYQALTYYVLNPQVALYYTKSAQEYVQKNFCAGRMAHQYDRLFNQ